MRLEWLEDILAVAETGSMIRAAERRFLTQSAFSRRLRGIEEHLGVELFDRSRKPAVLRPGVMDLRDEMRGLADGLRKLRGDLARGDATDQSRIVIASQHAITTALAPRLIQAIPQPDEVDIRLRSANREDCYTLLLTRQADFMLFYSTDRQHLIIDQDFTEICVLGYEPLIPVFARHEVERLRDGLEQGHVPVVLYPREVFLGRVVRDEIWPQLGTEGFKPRAETALTLAALQFALMGGALAWVPRSLAQPHLRAGELQDLSETFGAARLALTIARLNGARSRRADVIWTGLRQDGPRHLADLLDRPED